MTVVVFVVTLLAPNISMRPLGPTLDRAAADHAEVIKLAPSDARCWRNRGLIRLFQGDNKAGIADYDKALQYDPADVFSWNNRGQAKLRLGDKRAPSRISGRRWS